MRTTLRRLAGAQILATAVRAVLAALLHWGLAASSPSLSVAGVGSRVLQYSVPLALGIGVWIVAPLWGSWIEARAPECTSFPILSRRAASVVIGTATIVMALATLVATWAITVLRIAISRDWHEGRMFLAPEYYSLVVTSYGTEVLAGAVLLALARHVPEQ